MARGSRKHRRGSSASRPAALADLAALDLAALTRLHRASAPVNGEVNGVDLDDRLAAFRVRSRQVRPGRLGATDGHVKDACAAGGGRRAAAILDVIGGRIPSRLDGALSRRLGGKKGPAITQNFVAEALRSGLGDSFLDDGPLRTCSIVCNARLTGIGSGLKNETARSVLETLQAAKGGLVASLGRQTV
jgi:hypothetical protein